MLIGKDTLSSLMPNTRFYVHLERTIKLTIKSINWSLNWSENIRSVIAHTGIEPDLLRLSGKSASPQPLSHRRRSINEALIGVLQSRCRHLSFCN